MIGINFYDEENNLVGEFDNYLEWLDDEDRLDSSEYSFDYTSCFSNDLELIVGTLNNIGLIITKEQYERLEKAVGVDSYIMAQILEYVYPHELESALCAFEGGWAYVKDAVALVDCVYEDLIDRTLWDKLSVYLDYTRLAADISSSDSTWISVDEGYLYLNR